MPDQSDSPQVMPLAVVHVVVQRFESLDGRARELASVSRDFH